ncbi:hypothetical protein JCM11251_002118 [Rhodosporidiobolus azoricus]
MLRKAGCLGLLLLAHMVASSPLDSLSPRYDHTALGSLPEDVAPATVSELEGEFKRYGALIAVHGVIAFLAFQVFMPLAVVFAAVGKTSFPSAWFKWHSRTQVFLVTPMAILAIVLVGVAAATRPSLVHDGISRHGVLGFIILGIVTFQLAIGWYAHFAQARKEQFAAENGLPEPAPKRRLANWAHIAVGVTLLTLGGLQVTWGFGEYASRLGQSVPTWVEVVHYVIAGIPVLIVTPFVLVRGVMRIRDGQSFTEAFLTHPPQNSKVVPPPRKFFLGSSSYIDEAYGPSGIVFDEVAEKDGIGHEYAKGKGLDGRARVDSTASSWPGYETREQYEADLASRQSQGGSVVEDWAGWDYTRYDDGGGGRGTSSLLSAAAPMGRSTTQAPRPASQPSQAAPLPSPVFYPPSWNSALPPVSPIIHSTSPTPSTLAATVAASVAASLPPPPAPASSFSPRLSFMPFPGEAPVVPPAGTSAAPAYESTLTPSSTASERSNLAFLAVRDQPDGEGKAPSPATLVPSPPPPDSSATPLAGTGFVPAKSLRRKKTAGSVETSIAAACDGEAGKESLAEDEVSPIVTRHISLQGKIEGSPVEGTQDSLREEKEEAEVTPSTKLEDGRKEQSESDKVENAPERLPSPSFPPSDNEADKHDEDVPLTFDPDDAESTRLMDELERELTISTMRSGRSWATTTYEDEKAEDESEAGASDEAKTVASGVWLGGKKD